MDPNATLKAISDALRIGDTDAAKRAALDLVAWLHRGGFPPDWQLYPVSQAYVQWFAAKNGATL